MAAPAEVVAPFCPMNDTWPLEVVEVEETGVRTAVAGPLRTMTRLDVVTAPRPAWLSQKGDVEVPGPLLLQGVVFWT